MKEEHLGSDFDEFLAEEGLLAEAEAVALKRVVAFQIAELMKDKLTECHKETPFTKLLKRHSSKMDGKSPLIPILFPTASDFCL